MKYGLYIITFVGTTIVGFTKKYKYSDHMNFAASMNFSCITFFYVLMVSFFIVYMIVYFICFCLTLRLLMSYIYMEPIFLMFLDHTQRRTTVGRIPLDE